jgi:hypothetical protein
MIKRSPGITLLVGLLTLSLPVSAQLFKRDPGDEIVLPNEEALQMPAPPKSENLVRFDPGYATDLQFSIDAPSLKAGASDRIVRYTLLIKSAAGAANISYEGLRCDTADRKIYAYGRSDGGWSPVRDPQWKSVLDEPYRRTLFDYFCPRNSAISNAEEGLNAIRRGVHPNLFVH